jgi:hypothetical protein
MAPEMTADPIARTPAWLPHRYDAAGDRVHFVEVDRARHRATTFLTDAELPGTDRPRVLDRAAAVAGAGPQAPLHFLFHSAFCCSTLLVRALDRDGVAMGLSEPQILNDIVGWRHRTPVEGARVAEVLDHAMTLLARPWSPGEAVIVKPSNLINSLAPAMLGLRPDSSALLLHAPLEAFLGSIARKGLWGRLWVRELFVKLRREGALEFGLSAEDLFQLTDIQVAALCWLGQHRQFASLAARYPARVRTLDSEVLMARPAEALAALAAQFRLPLDAAAIADTLQGPAFTRHSKSGQRFDGQARIAEREAGLKAHADEVEKVAAWARTLADTHSISLDLPNPLLG